MRPLYEKPQTYSDVLRHTSTRARADRPEAVASLTSEEGRDVIDITHDCPDIIDLTRETHPAGTETETMAPPPASVADAADPHDTTGASQQTQSQAMPVKRSDGS